MLVASHVWLKHLKLCYYNQGTEISFFFMFIFERDRDIERERVCVPGYKQGRGRQRI